MTYAIFKAAGFQYRAELGDVLRLPSLDVESGATLTFEEVLMGASDGETLIGTPTLDGARVQAEVLRHGRADKVIVFKFKRRKNYRRKAGHRQDFTEIRINEIDLGGKHKVTLEPPKKKAKPAKKAKTKAKDQPPAADEAAAAKATPEAKQAAPKKAKTSKGKKAAAKKTKTQKKKTKAKGSGAAKKKSDSRSKKKKS